MLKNNLIDRDLIVFSCSCFIGMTIGLPSGLILLTVCIYLYMQKLDLTTRAQAENLKLEELDNLREELEKANSTGRDLGKKLHIARRIGLKWKNAFLLSRGLSPTESLEDGDE